MVAAVIRRHGGGAAWHLKDAGAEADLGGLPGQPAEDGGGVGAVGLGSGTES